MGGPKQGVSRVLGVVRGMSVVGERVAVPVSGLGELFQGVQKGGVQDLQGGVLVPLEESSHIFFKRSYTVVGPE